MIPPPQCLPVSSSFRMCQRERLEAVDDSQNEYCSVPGMGSWSAKVVRQVGAPVGSSQRFQCRGRVHELVDVGQLDAHDYVANRDAKLWATLDVRDLRHFIPMGVPQNVRVVLLEAEGVPDFKPPVVPPVLELFELVPDGYKLNRPGLEVVVDDGFERMRAQVHLFFSF